VLNIKTDNIVMLYHVMTLTSCNGRVSIVQDTGTSMKLQEGHFYKQ